MRFKILKTNANVTPPHPPKCGGQRIRLERIVQTLVVIGGKQFIADCVNNYLSRSLIVVASSNTSLQSLRKARNSLMIDWYSEP
jgi:hypothetical protein